MPKIWKSIVLAVAALVGSGATVCCITPEYVDSLRIELAMREMPERILYLPYALADRASDRDRVGIWAIPALDALRWAGNKRVTIDTVDIRTDLHTSTLIALDRLQELYGQFGDWDRAIVAYAESPAAAASLRDSTGLAGAVIIKGLREVQNKFELVPAHNAFEGLEALAESRRSEREALLQAEANARKARLDSLRKVQAANVDKITYTIRSGDTLGGIAARYRVKLSDLKRWNGLSGDFIREGRKLVIYKQ